MWAVALTATHFSGVSTGVTKVAQEVSGSAAEFTLTQRLRSLPEVDLPPAASSSGDRQSTIVYANGLLSVPLL